jgi:hypothetical protein
VNPLELRLSVNTDQIAAQGWTDLAFALELRNISTTPVDVYPAIAQFTPASGWYSPAWDILLEAPPLTPKIRELRTYYGPPGMPPNKSVFEQQRQTLTPAEVWRAQVAMCFIPRNELPDAECTRAILDPQGMDGITDDELRQSVLVLHATAGDLRKRPAGQLLRGGQFTSYLAFVPSRGTLDIFVRYRQDTWHGFFEPKQSLVAESNRLTLRIG